MNIFRELARILRVHDDQIEDALANVRRAQTQLSRRGFFAAAGVLATAPLLAPGDRVWSCPQSRIAGLCKVALPQFPLMIVPGMRFVVMFHHLGDPPRLERREMICKAVTGASIYVGPASR